MMISTNHVFYGDNCYDDFFYLFYASCLFYDFPCYCFFMHDFFCDKPFFFDFIIDDGYEIFCVLEQKPNLFPY